MILLIDWWKFFIQTVLDVLKDFKDNAKRKSYAIGILGYYVVTAGTVFLTFPSYSDIALKLFPFLAKTFWFIVFIALFPVLFAISATLGLCLIFLVSIVVVYLCYLIIYPWYWGRMFQKHHAEHLDNKKREKQERESAKEPMIIRHNSQKKEQEDIAILKNHGMTDEQIEKLKEQRRLKDALNRFR